MDIYEKCGCRNGIRSGTKLKEVDSIVQPKYTRSGLKNGKDRAIGVGKGWSIEGIYHFNILIKQVKKDCEDHSEFVTKWLAERNQSSNSRRQVSHVSLKYLHIGPYLRRKVKEWMTREIKRR